MGKRVSYDQAMTEPTVVEVIAVEPLPLGANGSRRAIVRWTDGSVGEALRWWDDLSGDPHKSAYPDERIMPRESQDRDTATARCSA